MNGAARGTSVRADGAGPYRFGQRLKALKWLSRYLGEVYRARHSETEQPELVLMRKRRGRFASRLRLRIEPGYIGLRLALPSVPDDLAAVRRDVLMAMRDARETLEVAGQQPGVLEDLLSPVPLGQAAHVMAAAAAESAAPAHVAGEVPPVAATATPSAGFVRRHGLRSIAAVAAVAGLAAWLLPFEIDGARAPRNEDIVYVAAQPDDLAWADVVHGASTPAPLRLEKRLVVPKDPYPNQATAPCTGRSVNLNGGCWYALEDRPPCPPKAAEKPGTGKCWVPVAKDPSEAVIPTSIWR